MNKSMEEMGQKEAARLIRRSAVFFLYLPSDTFFNRKAMEALFFTYSRLPKCLESLRAALLYIWLSLLLLQALQQGNLPFLF